MSGGSPLEELTLKVLGVALAQDLDWSDIAYNDELISRQREIHDLISEEMKKRECKPVPVDRDWSR